MTVMMGREPWTQAFLHGAAERLAAAGAGAWKPDGSYAASDVGVYMQVLPTKPDRGIAIAHYDVDPSLHGHGVQGLTVRCRGTKDPTVVGDIADSVFDALHGLRAVMFRSVFVAVVWRQSHSPLGADGTGRWQTTSNFYALTTRQSPHASE